MINAALVAFFPLLVNTMVGLLKWGVIKQKVEAPDLITNELIGQINQIDAAKVASEAKAYRYAR